MTDAISHRGPDAFGLWHSVDLAVHFGHRRLSIMDLSDSGAQPMSSHCSRYQIVYNGEIYNHLELRKQIQNAQGPLAWRGHSDTETLLAAISCWGFEQTLKKLNGMFAIALWDDEQKALYLARDRMGEKPLYYGRLGDGLVFGSELSALRAHPDWTGEIDADSVNAFIRYSSVPAPRSIYQNIKKLPAAHWLKIASPKDNINEPSIYWSLLNEPTHYEVDFNDEQSSLDALEAKLINSVQSRTLADVPLGTFLSGGIDSSLVTALLQSQSAKPIQTFTIGFGEENYNEAPYAKDIANHLGTDHTEQFVTEKEALELVPDLATIYDEPFADSSQIPTLLLSEMTRKHVTVSLSGDGGDELFYGYSRYPQSLNIWNNIKRAPNLLRKPVSSILGKATPELINSLDAHTNNRMQGLRKQLLRAEAMGKSIGAGSFPAFYEQMLTTARQPVCSLGESVNASPWVYKQDYGLNEEQFMMFADMNHYLPEVVLTKVDRASMRFGLESRAPLLDHKLAEFAWAMPQTYKHRDGTSKWALQQILHRYIPKELFERPKMGFGVPIDHWLKGALKPWAIELLSDESLEKHGYLNSKYVRRLFDDHLSGRANHQYALWNILMLQAWLASQ